ncbi:MAG TPA: hypothetical protein VF746_19585 [Longimicrobium sp.]|jgi:hypothetical protein
MQPLGATGETPGHWTPADRASVLVGLLLVGVALVWQLREATERKEAFSVAYETVHVRDDLLYYLVVDLANAGKGASYVWTVGWDAPGWEAAIDSGGRLVQPGETVHLVSRGMDWKRLGELGSPAKKVVVRTVRGRHTLAADAGRLRSFMELQALSRGASTDPATDEVLRRVIERLPFDPVRDSLVRRYGGRREVAARHGSAGPR